MWLRHSLELKCKILQTFIFLKYSPGEKRQIETQGLVQDFFLSFWSYQTSDKMWFHSKIIWLKRALSSDETREPSNTEILKWLTNKMHKRKVMNRWKDTFPWYHHKNKNYQLSKWVFLTEPKESQNMGKNITHCILQGKMIPWWLNLTMCT